MTINLKRITKMLEVLYIMFFGLSIIGIIYFEVLGNSIMCGISGIVFGYTYSHLFARIWRESWESSAKQQ